MREGVAVLCKSLRGEIIARVKTSAISFYFYCGKSMLLSMLPYNSNKAFFLIFARAHGAFMVFLLYCSFMCSIRLFTLKCIFGSPPPPHMKSNMSDHRLQLFYKCLEEKCPSINIKAIS